MAYVEAYEHRVVMGNPAGMQVHHRDGNKANNHPSNLELVDIVEHAKHHGSVLSAQSKRVTQWDGHKCLSRYLRSKRRQMRQAMRRDLQECIAGLYLSGLSTIQVGEVVGRNTGTISRDIREAGFTARG